MSRDEIAHLTPSLSMIAGRTVFAGLMSALPVPIVDEWLAGRAREALLRRIAELRRVGADEDSITLLADVGDEALDFAIDAAEAASFFRSTFRRVFRRASGALRLARFGDEATRTFTVAALFDHYCARHHLGAGLDAARARRLRKTIDGAIADARGALTRRALGAVGRSTRGLLLAGPRRLGLVAPDEAALAQPLSPEESALATRPDPDEGRFAAAGRAWLEELTRAFDRRWLSQKHE